MASKVKFIHLHVHSTYSLLESSVRIKALCERAHDDSQPAIALTDTNNLFGALEFTSACLGKNIQPIIGCQLTTVFDDNTTEGSLVFLAKSEQGLKNLMKLSSIAYLGYNNSPSTTDNPHIKLSWLKDIKEGLVVLTGGVNGPVNKALHSGNIKIAQDNLEALYNIFGNDLYIELQRYNNYNKDIEAFLLKQALLFDIEIVATNESFFINKSDYEAHDALLAIAEGQLLANKNRRRVTSENFLKTQDEMEQLFKDLPIAIENTIKIAQSCTSFVRKKNPILPHFISEVFEPEELKKQAYEGLEKRLKTSGYAKNFTKEDYKKRLEYELDIIIRMQFSGYFLIVADFIKWAKENDIPVGPGRGSGAGALVAYALTITDIDPLRFSLLFERFLNPERVSMPDFDIDFCQERRGEVIKYVQSKYGNNRVANIITFGTLQARGVLRDVGRVLEIPYSKVDYLCKLVPQNPGVSLSLKQAISEEPKFSEEKSQDPAIERLLEIALQLEGLYRHASTHAAGIVIGDRPLEELVPLYFDSKSMATVTQYSMKYVEQAGLVKFDFLGLKTLSVLKKASQLIQKKGKDFDLNAVSLQDEATYKLLSAGETLGVFQVESSGMQQALIGMQPDCIEDIIALVALYRPGPMENIPLYNSRKNAKEPVEYIHPALESVLRETQGVIIYQEQVMEIAQLLAGYSLGEADLLRRAMGKKIHSEMAIQRTRFVEGAVERGLDNKHANEIFDLLAKFADYGFNKSHAAAYAMISYQTAYLKANYPVEFLAAIMTYDILNTEKLNVFRLEAKRLNIDILSPSIQYSGADFGVGENKIYYSLASIKGVGEKVAEHIAFIRGNKPFKNIEDFCNRINPKEINKTALENLICAGALDCFNIARDKLFKNVSYMLHFAASIESNNISLYDDLNNKELCLKDCNIDEKWGRDEKLHNEFKSVGAYISGHPLDYYNLNKSFTKDLLGAKPIKKDKYSKALGIKTFTTGGTLVGKQLKKTKRGDRMAILTFSQPSDQQFEALLFADKWNEYADQLIVGSSMLLTFEVYQLEDNNDRINISCIRFLKKEDKQQQIYYSNLELKVTSLQHITSINKVLKQVQTQQNSDVSELCNVKICYNNLEFDLGNNFKVNKMIYLALNKLVS